MNKIRIIFSSLVVLLSTVYLPASVFAQEPDLLYNETQAYSVVLRGNGESVISNRITITNNKDTVIDNYTFEIPNLNVSDLVGYQIQNEQYCVQYEYDSQNKSSASSAINGKCLHYEEQSYVGSNSTYKKLTFSNNGNKRVVALPTAIQPGKSSTIVISYIGKGYVHKRLGVFSFNFETIKSQNRVKTVNISLDVDAKFVLNSGKSKVNYAQTNSDSSSTILSAGANVNSAKMDQAVSSIGSGGSITESATNLAANESYSVKGSYASAAWKLHIVRYIVTGIIGLILFAGVFYVSRRYYKKGLLSRVQSQSVQPGKPYITSLIDPLVVASGFVSSLITVILTVVIAAADKKSENVSSGDTFNDLLTVIIVIVLYILALLSPAILIAVRRRDWRAFIYSLFWVFAWLVIAASIYKFGIASDTNTTRPNDEYYSFPQNCPNC